MRDQLDPEEVRDITSRIFGDIAKVVTQYDGFIEKFIGDAVMAVFGVPEAHEDDPVRAIKAEKEIHDIVDSLSPKIEEFRSNLDLNKIQWREGHAYPFAQNISYYPMIDLLNRTLKIEESDSPDKINRSIIYS